uniref:Guanylate cyclase n=1 Tax=Strongyloides venezuelensis TaxID=75913 RepID=A0A0K0F8E6_STRVS
MLSSILFIISVTVIKNYGIVNSIKFSYSNVSPIDIVVALPKDGTNKKTNPYGLDMLKSKPVFDVVLEDIYYDKKLLPANFFRLTYVDTENSDAIGPQRVIDRYCAKKIDAVMGLPYVYGLAPIARFSVFWNLGVPVFSTSAKVDIFSNREQFPLLTRLTESNARLGSVFDQVMPIQAKKLFFYFHEQENQTLGIGKSECYFTLKAMKNNIRSDKFGEDHSSRTFNEYTIDKKILFQQHIKNLKAASFISKVIILCASPDTVRDIMLAAYDLGMTQSGEYVFINIDVSTGSHAEQPWLRSNDTNPKNNEIAEQAYKALKTISLRRSAMAEYDDFEKKVKKRAEEVYNYKNITGKEYEMNNFISAFYDAVLLYAIALNKTISEGKDARSGKHITNKMWGITFKGITGNVSIDKNGDRYSDYSLLDLDPKERKFVEVAYYSGNKNELKKVSDFHWVGGSPPKDSPVCGWDNSLCNNGEKYYPHLLVAAIVVIIFLAAAFIFFYRRYRLEKEIAAMSWKIRWEELKSKNSESHEKKQFKKKNKSHKAVLYNDPNADQHDALLRINSNGSVNSDKFTDEDPEYMNMRQRLRSSSSGATRKISAMIFDRKLSLFTRKKSSPTSDKVLDLNNGTYDENHPSSPIEIINKKLPTHSEDLEYGNGGFSFKNRKLSIQYSNGSIKSGGSVETIHMANNSKIFIRYAYYKGQTAAVKMLKIDPVKYPKLELSRDTLMEFKRIREYSHDHIIRVMGACVDAPNYCIVTEYCQRGSLEDILEDEKIKLDTMMKFSLLHDLVKGMNFLHHSEIRSHGRLKPSNCVVDSRFVLKITDYGLNELRAYEEISQEKDDSHEYWKKFMYTAPELLRLPNPPRGGTQKGDVYSFGLIAHEVVYRCGPFYRGDESADPKFIYEQVFKGPAIGKEIYRPILLDEVPNEEGGPSKPESMEQLTALMQRCWSENPMDRPEFSEIRKIAGSLNKDNETTNLVDNLLKRMEQYANNLESLVEERTQEYLAEKKKVEELLHQLLPPSVAVQLIAGNSVQAESYDCVTIYFSDIVGFTSLSSVSTPMQVVTLLNDLYLAFDGVVDNFKVYKVETIGDAYMVVSGLPERRDDHASQIAQMSLALLHKVKTFVIRHRPKEQLKLRIGMHSGSVVAGVVGSKMPRYCLFGDTVNTSSRMESNGMPLKIHVSSQTHAILSKDPDFNLELRGEVEMKGKGLQTTYWLKGYKDQQIPDFGPDYSNYKIPLKK